MRTEPIEAGKRRPFRNALVRLARNEVTGGKWTGYESLVVSSAGAQVRFLNGIDFSTAATAWWY